MSKHSLAWHEECYRNMSQSLEGYHKEEEARHQHIVRLSEDLELLRQQILAARDRGLEGFDGERFLVPRKQK